MDAGQEPGPSSSMIDDFANASADAREAARRDNPADSPELENVAFEALYDENDILKYGNDPGSRDAFLQTSRISQRNILRDYNQVLQNIPTVPIDAKDVKRNNWSGLLNMVSRINETNENLRVLSRLGGEMMQYMMESTTYHIRANTDGVTWRDASTARPISKRPRKAVSSEVDPETRKKAKHYIHFKFAELGHFFHKAPSDFPAYSVPLTNQGVTVNLPAPLGDDCIHTQDVVVGVDEAGENVVLPKMRPDWMNKKRPASVNFINKVKELFNKEFVNYPAEDLIQAVDQYWETCERKYKRQNGLERVDVTAKEKAFKTMLDGRAKYLYDNRHMKFASSPLAHARRADWYASAFQADQSRAPKTILAPILLGSSTDFGIPDLEGKSRYHLADDFDEKQYWIHRCLSRYATGDEAWEVVDVWWMSPELRNVCMIMDSYIRIAQGKSNQRMYWRGPRQKWCDIDGHRSLPIVKTALLSGMPDMRDTTGYIIYRWMVDRDYVIKWHGEKGVEWCDSLFPNPPSRPRPHCSPLTELLEKPEYAKISTLFNHWQQQLLCPDDDIPSHEEMARDIQEWGDVARATQQTSLNDM